MSAFTNDERFLLQAFRAASQGQREALLAVANGALVLAQRETQAEGTGNRVAKPTATHDATPPTGPASNVLHAAFGR
jgi:hypothetical protein